MVKEKPEKNRIYDEDGYRKRAACLCVRGETEIEVLLVSSSGDKQSWVVPGGGIEYQEDPFSAAHREILEEAGVKGIITRCLGVFENRDRKHRTSVFVLRVSETLDCWDDSRDFDRKRQWFSLDEARAQLDRKKPLQQRYLDLFIQCGASGDTEQTELSPELVSVASNIVVSLSTSQSFDSVSDGAGSPTEESQKVQLQSDSMRCGAGCDEGVLDPPQNQAFMQSAPGDLSRNASVNCCCQSGDYCDMKSFGKLDVGFDMLNLASLPSMDSFSAVPNCNLYPDKGIDRLNLTPVSTFSCHDSGSAQGSLEPCNTSSNSLNPHAFIVSSPCSRTNISSLAPVIIDPKARVQVCMSNL